MEKTLYQAVFVAGHRRQFCLATSVKSTSPELLLAEIKAKGIDPVDVDIEQVDEAI